MIIKNTVLSKFRLLLPLYNFVRRPIFLLIIFLYVLIFIFYIHRANTTSSLNQQNPELQPTPRTTVTTSSPLANQAGLLSKEVAIIASRKNFTPEELENKSSTAHPNFATDSINQSTLSDGSIAYEYPSHNSKRPDLLIIKDGTVLFKRNLVSMVSITTYTPYVTNPPFAKLGSAYYGPNAVILANPELGVAVVYNPESNNVYEQYLFPATTVVNFKKIFGSDISAYNPIP